MSHITPFDDINLWHTLEDVGQRLQNLLPEDPNQTRLSEEELVLVRDHLGLVSEATRLAGVLGARYDEAAKRHRSEIKKFTNNDTLRTQEMDRVNRTMETLSNDVRELKDMVRSHGRLLTEMLGSTTRPGPGSGGMPDMTNTTRRRSPQTHAKGATESEKIEELNTQLEAAARTTREREIQVESLQAEKITSDQAWFDLVVAVLNASFAKTPIELSLVEKMFDFLVIPEANLQTNPYWNGQIRFATTYRPSQPPVEQAGHGKSLLLLHLACSEPPSPDQLFGQLQWIERDVMPEIHAHGDAQGMRYVAIVYAYLKRVLPRVRGVVFAFACNILMDLHHHFPFVSSKTWSDFLRSALPLMRQTTTRKSIGKLEWAAVARLITTLPDPASDGKFFSVRYHHLEQMLTKGITQFMPLPLVLLELFDQGQDTNPGSHFENQWSFEVRQGDARWVICWDPNKADGHERHVIFIGKEDDGDWRWHCVTETPEFTEQDGVVLLTVGGEAEVEETLRSPLPMDRTYLACYIAQRYPRQSTSAKISNVVNELGECLRKARSAALGGGQEMWKRRSGSFSEHTE